MSSFHARLVGVSLAFALIATGIFAGSARAQDFEGQIKINFIDATQAPKIRVYASLLKRRAKPPGEKELTAVTLFRKPDKSAPVEMFGFKDGEIVWAKDVTDEEKKEKDGTAPVLATAGELDTGAAIVVVAPGFEDPEYKNGTLGERSRNGAGLFFKKLGKTHKMNALWYSDFVYSYVYTEGRLSELAKLDQYLPQCRKWEHDQARHFGMTPEEAAAADGGEPPDPKAPVGPKKGEALCGLTAEYAGLGKIIAKTPYDGFWPQLFGLPKKICAAPDHPIKKTSIKGEAENGSGDRLTAIDAALEMLVRGAEPGQPRILILTGDGRDGYINAPDDCRVKYETECQTSTPSETPERSKAVKKCVDDKLQKDAATEQGAFAKKLPVWLGIAKAADIRIYAVIHPTAPKYARERLELLAWRTGGTPRYAEDANEVLDRYDDLIHELNSQIVLTFVDEEAKPETPVSYIIEGRLGGTKYTSEAFTAKTPPKVERSLIYEFKTFGQKKLGKVGFMAALIGVGLIVLLLLLKIVKKIAKKGDGAMKAGAKGVKGAQGAAKKGGDAAKKAKEKAKLVEKAKKAKEAQKKALEKAKKKAGG